MASSTSFELSDMPRDGGEDNAAYVNMAGEKPSGTVTIVVPDEGDEVKDGHDDAESDSDDEETGCRSTVGHVTTGMSHWYVAHSTAVKYFAGSILLLLWTAYFIWTMIYHFQHGFDSTNEPAIRLLSINIFGIFCVSYWAVKKYCGSRIWESCLRPCTQRISAFVSKHGKALKWVAGILTFVGVATLVFFDVALKEPSNLISLSGLAVYIILCYIFSAHPSKVRWRPVILGLLIQFIFAYLILRTCVGYLTFKWLGDRVMEFLEHTNAGSIFVFGENYAEHNFAFKVLPVVIFFSAAISMLYYLGVTQIIIEKVAWLMQVTMGTTAGESLNASANIFIGLTEAPLIIKPLLPNMTKSELHAVMTGGFSTIAGTVLATYISFGVPANHLLSASIMSAPAALAISKLFYPETRRSKTKVEDILHMEKSPDRNLIEAASSGASTAVKLVANVAANVLAFLALLEFLNKTLTWIGALAGSQQDITFQYICSYVLFPFAYVMGTPLIDCKQVATLIGIKTFANPFIAYNQLGKLINNRIRSESWESELLNQTVVHNAARDCYFLQSQTHTGDCLPMISEKGEIIATYALCGFANLGSIGITLGVLGAMVPERKRDIATTVLRAMIAGNIACFMTACIAGLLAVPGALNPETCGTI